MKSTFKDRTCFCNSEKFRNFCNVYRKSRKFKLSWDCFYHSIEYLNSVWIKSIVLFKFSIHKIKYIAILLWNIFQKFFKHRSSPLNSSSWNWMTSNKLCYIGKPNLIKTRPFKVRKGKLKYSECFFKVKIIP